LRRPRRAALNRKNEERPKKLWRHECGDSIAHHWFHPMPILAFFFGIYSTPALPTSLHNTRQRRRHAALLVLSLSTTIPTACRSNRLSLALITIRILVPTHCIVCPPLRRRFRNPLCSRLHRRSTTKNEACFSHIVACVSFFLAPIPLIRFHLFFIHLPFLTVRFLPIPV